MSTFCPHSEMDREITCLFARSILDTLYIDTVIVYLSWVRPILTSYVPLKKESQSLCYV